MYQRILVPVDGSTPSRAGLTEAIKLGKLTGATLRLVHVIDIQPYAGLDGGIPCPPDMVRALRESGEAILKAAAAQVEAAGLKPQSQLIETFAGRASELIVDEARSCGAELIVIGTHGRRGLRRFMLGSDAEQVLRNSPTPVLLVRSSQGAQADKP